ncbi:ribose 5-phosphate isomerase A-domain-containing protein [Lipomyces oligophaga]|uniref:ribose 5-phosphate isomerase A-domain-containing protein n=1 Tax=Lipomyces oligophaga TaxID=45792 RepID=UPI0034CF567C
MIRRILGYSGYSGYSARLGYLGYSGVSRKSGLSKLSRLPRFSRISLCPQSTMSLDPIESAKRLAAYTAIDTHFPASASVIGIGSGSTVIYCVERIVQKVAAGEIAKDVVYVPTGFQSKELIIQGGLRLGAIDNYPVLDAAFDGADEVDTALNCIKGGGACLFQEKLVAQCAKKFIVVADFRKNSSALGTAWVQGVPIEVVPLAHARVTADLLAMGAISAKLRLGGKAKAGPVITDNSNTIIDAHFGAIADPVALAKSIKLLVGVVEVGLFVDMADAAYFGNENGSVTAKFQDGTVSTIV